MTNRKQTAAKTERRRPDCVTEIRMGNTVLVVSGFFKKDTTATAADKMMKVLEAETAAGQKQAYTA
ncbi:MAG: transposon-encoded TnpW family protein [Oscillospiraceae bacterium]